MGNSSRPRVLSAGKSDSLFGMQTYELNIVQEASDISIITNRVRTTAHIPSQDLDLQAIFWRWDGQPGSLDDRAGCTGSIFFLLLLFLLEALRFFSLSYCELLWC